MRSFARYAVTARVGDAREFSTAYDDKFSQVYKYRARRTDSVLSHFCRTEIRYIMDVSDSPPRKIFRTREFGSPNFSDSVPNINDVIDDVVETVDSLAQIFDAGGASITGSPGSVVAESEVSDVSLDQGIADKAA